MLSFCSQVNKNLVVVYVMIAILTLFGVVLVAMTLKVKRLVWKQDKVLPLVLMFMTACIAMYDFYFIVQAVVFNKIGWVYLNSYRWAYFFSYYSATLLLAIGAVLNVHKWILFLIRVQTSVKAEIVLVELKTALQQD